MLSLLITHVLYIFNGNFNYTSLLLIAYIIALN